MGGQSATHPPTGVRTEPKGKGGSAPATIFGRFISTNSMRLSPRPKQLIWTYHEWVLSLLMFQRNLANRHLRVRLESGHARPGLVFRSVRSHLNKPFQIGPRKHRQREPRNLPKFSVAFIQEAAPNKTFRFLLISQERNWLILNSDHGHGNFS